MKRGRPQKSQEDINEILRIFEENKANVVVNGKLPSRNDPIWNDLCLQSNNLFSSLSFFTMASKDYYNIKHILGIDKPPQVPTLFEVENESSPESKVSSDSEIDSTAPEDIKFDIILSYEEYISLNKHTTTYKRNDKFEKKNKVRKLESREYTTFEPRHWSHIISKKIEVKLCEHGNYCAIIFKRNKIFITCESKFAEFHGYCKECKGKLFGYIESPPTEDEDIMVNFTLTNFSPHSKTSFKRPLSGRSRIELGEHLVRTNIAPSHYRKILASRDMVGHCDVPSWIPNLSTLRVAKNEQVKAGRYHDDPVYSICQMKVDPSMKGAIQNIGLDPFFVYIWTNTQIFVYNRYCSTEYAKLCIDATGGVVRKLTKITGEKSKHIFFYDCTVMSKTSKKDNQYSVCNFLSESQNAVSIYSWLAHWIRAGAVIPQEVVTDMSLALMYAVTLAFTNSKSLEQYIHNCFKAVIEHDPFNEKCFIRLDVAHFVKLVSQWPSLKKQHRLTRQFYLRAIGQLIQSTTIEDIENIIKAICTVALSDTEGTGLLTGTPTTCEIRKNWLKRRLASGSIEILLSVQEDNNDSQHNTNDFLKDNNNLSYFGNWVRFIAEDCKKLVNTEVEEGDRGNQQCLPAFIEDLTKISKYLPLFTGVMTQYFPSANIIGSSATVESNINDIKNRIFGNVKLPMRVDDFLKNFILSADGASKLAESEMNEIDQSNNKVDVSPYSVLHLNLKPRFKINVTRKDNPKRHVAITKCTGSFTFIKYTETNPQPNRKFDIKERIMYKPVLIKPDSLKPVVMIGTAEGDFAELHWEGQDFDSGETVNCEQAKYIYDGKYHDGPVTSIQKCKLSNIILTVGGKIFALWRADFPGRPILWRRSRQFYTQGLLNIFQPFRIILHSTGGVLTEWILPFNSKAPVFCQVMSNSFLTAAGLHPYQTEKLVYGIGDEQGAFRLSIIRQSSGVYLHNMSKAMQVFIEREINRKKLFLKWQDDFNKRNEGYLAGKKELDEKKAKEEEAAKKAKIDEQIIIDKSVQKRPQPGKFKEWIIEQRRLKEEARIKAMIINKKQLDTKELEKRRKPLQKLDEENERKKRKQKERLKEGETIFKDTVASLFPDVMKEKPPPPPDPYAGGDIEELKETCYNMYDHLSNEMDSFIRDHPLQYEFNFKNLLVASRNKDTEYFHTHQHTKRFQQEKKLRKMGDSLSSAAEEEEDKEDKESLYEKSKELMSEMDLL